MTTEEIRATSKVFQRGKTQVPSEVRRSLGVKDGDTLVWIIAEGRWIIKRG